MSELPGPGRPGDNKGHKSRAEDRPGLQPANDPSNDPRVKVDAAWETDNYYMQKPKSAPPRRLSDGEFSPMTWVMIIVAGVVLGFAIAMMFAGA
jgi:hypothetical protein